ncbi:MAG: hypothetical protein JRJ59_04040 [Deltaproteobacteria bacterium]|nr:hypothetical protein [Deltaproteobacteria bacterium]
MSPEWLKAVFVSLAAGLGWSAFREFTAVRRLKMAGQEQRFNLRRLAGLAVLGWAVCLGGLVLLTQLGLTNLPPF